MPLNHLLPEDLEQIVARASTLFERLDGGLEPCGRPEDEETVSTRLAEWRRMAAQDDPELFARRLAWDGLDEAAARRALAPVRVQRSCRLPPWAGMLEELLGDTPIGHQPSTIDHPPEGRAAIH